MVREKFKSYYVVWKPKPIQKQCQQTLKFKSYYVVWKPKYPQ